MRRDRWHQTRKKNGQTREREDNTLKCNTCGKPHKNRRLLEWSQCCAANDPRFRHHQQQEQRIDNPVQPTANRTINENKKIVTLRLCFGETVDPRVYSVEDPLSNTLKARRQIEMELQQRTGKDDKKSQPK